MPTVNGATTLHPFDEARRQTTGERITVICRPSPSLTQKAPVQRTEGFAPWYHLCSPPPLRETASPGANTPSLANGSTRPVLLGAGSVQRAEGRISRHDCVLHSAVCLPRPFFRRLGGLLRSGGVPRALHRPPARWGALPDRSCPRHSLSLVRLWKSRPLVNQRGRRRPGRPVAHAAAAPKCAPPPRRSRRRCQHPSSTSGP